MADETPVAAWPRVKWTRAGQVAALVEGLPLDGLADAPPAAAFAALRAANPVQALRFMAQCLPRVEGVRWAAAALQTMAGVADPRRLAARKAVNRWLNEPSDASRRLCLPAGETAGFDTAEGAACLAVFLSGGSMAPPEQEQGVPPPPGAFGQALAASVFAAAHNDDALGLAERLEQALALGERLAVGDPG